MHQVQANAELEAIHRIGAGFVFNDFTSGPAGASDNVLHLAGCPWVGRMLYRAEPQRRPSVRKIFFTTINEAHWWLAANRGPEGRGWKPCDTCRPGHVEGIDRLRLQAGGPSPSGREAKGRLARISQAIPTPVSDSWPVDAAFAMPSSQPLPLPVGPRLASWNKRGDPDQVRLAEYLAIADDRPHYAPLSGPLALRLDVGLPRQADLLDQRDLDNYLSPGCPRQQERGRCPCLRLGHQQHAARSYVRIERAAPAAGAPLFDCGEIVRTTASTQSAEFKEEIRDQLGAATPLLPGPLRLQLSFTVGPAHNWLNLRKQTIDALGQILGHGAGSAPWSPLDGRIVDLGLHCRVDPALGNEVLIAIAAQRIRP
jgi:hypothetical protein